MVASSSRSNSLKEYLKRYETNADEEKKKKKKKKTKTKPEAKAYHSLPTIEKRRLKLEALDKIQKRFDTHVAVDGKHSCLSAIAA
nr:hypothetical protein [Tanacetum cinerariifolium]